MVGRIQRSFCSSVPWFMIDGNTIGSVHAVGPRAR